MKNWQKGIELAEINRVKTQFKDYNNCLVSPFTQIGGPKVADAMSRGEVISFGNDTVIFHKVAKAKSQIKMFPGVIVSDKLKGDNVISAFTGDKDTIIKYIDSLYSSPTWVIFNVENKDQHKIADELLNFNYYRVGTQFNAYGEIFGVMFRDSIDSIDQDTPRKHPELDKLELLTMKRLEIPNFSHLMDSFNSKLSEFESIYKSHPSKKNTYGSWDALSLRGWSSDPSELGSPRLKGSMFSNLDKNTSQLQDTELMDVFKDEMTEILSYIPTNQFERIRIMRLKPGGEIKRHSDKMTEVCGVQVGMDSRFHIPIRTEPEVVFHMWDHNGIQQDVSMKTGETWYFDKRHPHCVTHNGKEDRIHLVFDAIMTDEFRTLISK